jgi:hypothetical protein
MNSRISLLGPTRLIAVATVVCCSTALAIACNIPVFRYALERWTPDSSEIVLFTEGPPAGEAAEFLTQLQQQAATQNQPVNATVFPVDITRIDDPAMQGLWQQVQNSSAAKTPWVVVRSRHGRGKIVNHWSSSLQDAEAASLQNSPVRRELTRRLQHGDAIVWLVLKPAKSDAPAHPALADCLQMLQQQCRLLPNSLELPEGIGLPGSELYSEVPLLLQFSVLELAADNPAEKYLVQQLAGFQQQAFDAGEPLVIPVFGRGRALEVIPASKLSADLVHDLSQFLCGACSCQVKEQNPGFDLLISADWNKALFGESGELPPPPAEPGSGQNKAPVLLPIPGGRR